MNAVTQNHYETLGLTRDATPEEIKRAWAKLVRIHTPDKDPEVNRRLNESKATLLDPEARQDYDSLLDFGEEITDLLDNAQTAEEEERWFDAAEAYKEILAFHPTNHAARNRLALCYSYGGDNAQALRTLEYLLRKQDKIPIYWSNYGHILEETAENNEAEILEKAKVAFERAAELEPHNAAHQISLSRHWRRRQDYRRAEEHIDRAVGADGKADLDDLEALFELPWIHLFAGELHKLHQDAERIRSLIPEDFTEALEYAAFRLLKMANELAKADLYRQAAAFVQASRSLQTVQSDLEDWAKWIETNARIREQGEVLADDNAMLKAVSSLGIAYIAKYFDEVPEDKAESFIDTMIEAIETWPNAEVVASIDRLEKKYPDVYAINTQLFDACRNLGHRGYQSSNSGGHAPYSGGAGGCCVLPVLVFAFSLLMIAATAFAK